MQKADYEEKRIMVVAEKVAETYAAIEKQYRPRILNFFCRLTGPEDAHDLTQETFLRVYKGLPKFEGEAKLGIWIYRIARNLSVNYYRAQARHSSGVSFSDLTYLDSKGDFLNYEDITPSEEDGPEENVLLSELEELVRRAVNKLPVHMRDVYELQASEELSYEDTAAILNIPVGTMKSRIDRARAKLRVILRPYVYS